VEKRVQRNLISGHNCNCIYCNIGKNQYIIYTNPDPSSSSYALQIADKIFTGNEETITKEAKRIYHIRAQAILARDLRHETIRILADIYCIETLRIDNFERKNRADLRYYFTEDHK